MEIVQKIGYIYLSLKYDFLCEINISINLLWFIGIFFARFKRSLLDLYLNSGLRPLRSRNFTKFLCIAGTVFQLSLESLIPNDTTGKPGFSVRFRERIQRNKIFLNFRRTLFEDERMLILSLLGPRPRNTAR